MIYFEIVLSDFSFFAHLEFIDMTLAYLRLKFERQKHAMLKRSKTL